MMKQKFIFILLLSFNITSAQNFIKKERIQEVTISANRAESNNNLSNIFIINHEDIKDSPVQTVEDLLEFATNIDLRQRGGDGVQSDLSIRGGTFEQVLIMINGVKLNDPQTGHHNMMMPVNVDQIERIEIVTGGASRIFGNHAYTGVINIITKIDFDNLIKITAGTYEYKNLELSQNITENNTKHNFSFNSKKSDGYMNNMDYDIESFFYNLNYQNKSLKTSINFGHIDKKFGAFSFYTPKYPNQYEETKTTFMSFQMKHKKARTAVNQQISWRQNLDEFILFRESPNLYHNFHRNHKLNYNINIVQNTNTGSNVIGGEIIYDQILSNRLGQDLNNTDMFENYTKGDQRTNINFFAEKNIKIQNLSISSGIMITVDSDYGEDYFPGIDVNFEISKELEVFSSFNKSMRHPNYTELYYTSPTNIGNQFLKSEQSYNKEFGFRWSNLFHEFKFTCYKRKGENMIDWVLMHQDSVWRAMNLSEATTTGFELNSKIDVNKIIKTNLPLSNIIINYAYNKKDTTSNGFQSAYVLDYLQSNLSIKFYFNLTNQTIMSWNTTRQDRQGGYRDFATNEEVEYIPFWNSSSRITHKLSENKEVFVEVRNIFDQVYVDFGNIPQPGRWIRSGVKIYLN